MLVKLSLSRLRSSWGSGAGAGDHGQAQLLGRGGRMMNGAALCAAGERGFGGGGWFRT